jgi:hypothetical protein
VPLANLEAACQFIQLKQRLKKRDQDKADPFRHLSKPLIRNASLIEDNLTAVAAQCERLRQRCDLNRTAALESEAGYAELPRRVILPLIGGAVLRFKNRIRHSKTVLHCAASISEPRDNRTSTSLSSMTTRVIR